MSEKEKKETEEKKLEGGKEGKQFVGNTEKAKGAREEANQEESEKYEKKRQAKGKGQSKRKGGEEKEDNDNDEEEQEGLFVEDDEDGEREEDEEYEEDSEDDEESDINEDKDVEEDGDDDDDDDDAEQEDGKKQTRGQKRGRGSGKSTNGTSTSNKKQKSNSGNAKKTVGSKHQPADAPAPQASADRLPEKGQKVTWKALPGWVEGEVIEVVYENKTIEGKSTKASKEDPRIFMRSKNGKVAVHKPEAVYFERV